jgi:sulfatase maturation enzyme AslB (radical SAM superfamily)
MEDMQIVRITIDPTLLCNFACDYCYVQPDATPLDVDKTKMILKNAIDSVTQNELLIHYLGGEPLCAFETVKEISTYFRDNCGSKIPQFRITTNGSLINKDIIQHFLEFNYFVIVSVDTSPGSFTHRKYHNGESDVQCVVDNVKMLQEYGVKHCISMVVTNDTVKDFANSFQYFVDMGIKLIGFAPIYTDKRFTPDLDIYREQILKVAQIARKNGIEVNPPLKHGWNMKELSRRVYVGTNEHKVVEISPLDYYSVHEGRMPRFIEDDIPVPDYLKHLYKTGFYLPKEEVRKIAEIENEAHRVYRGEQL